MVIESKTLISDHARTKLPLAKYKWIDLTLGPLVWFDNNIGVRPSGEKVSGGYDMGKGRCSCISVFMRTDSTEYSTVVSGYVY